MNGEATDIALLPKAALPERLDEAKYDEEQDVFLRTKTLIRIHRFSPPIVAKLSKRHKFD